MSSARFWLEQDIQRLQAALADAEALELGTAEALAKAQARIKSMEVLLENQNDWLVEWSKAKERIKELEDTNTQLREGYSVMNKDWLKIQNEKIEQSKLIENLGSELSRVCFKSHRGTVWLDIEEVDFLKKALISYNQWKENK